MFSFLSLRLSFFLLSISFWQSLISLYVSPSFSPYTFSCNFFNIFKAFKLGHMIWQLISFLVHLDFFLFSILCLQHHNLNSILSFSPLLYLSIIIIFSVNDIIILRRSSLVGPWSISYLNQILIFNNRPNNVPNPNPNHKLSRHPSSSRAIFCMLLNLRIK